MDQPSSLLFCLPASFQVYSCQGCRESSAHIQGLSQAYLSPLPKGEPCLLGLSETNILGQTCTETMGTHGGNSQLWEEGSWAVEFPVSQV